MKEEQKIFIRGSKDRPNDVRKVLEQHRGKVEEVADFSYDNCIYYINHNGIVDYTHEGSELCNMLIEYYHEVSLPSPSEYWERGDILFSETDNKFAVFKHECKINSNSTDRFFCYLITCNGLCSTHQVISKIDFRLATKLEVEQFHKRLHAIKKDWDTEKKQLVDWKWKPVVGDRCWMVTSNGKVKEFIWFNSKTNMKLLYFGNCFHTKEEAKIAAKKIKHLLKEE